MKFDANFTLSALFGRGKRQKYRRQLWLRVKTGAPVSVCSLAPSRSAYHILIDGSRDVWHGGGASHCRCAKYDG
jgi:hypothetical protein